LFNSLQLGMALAACAVLLVPAGVQAQRGGRGGPPPTPRAAAAMDLTGYWVSVITEDWKFRMVTPKKGVYETLVLNAEGRRIGDAWDPARDEAAGEQCRAFGAAGVLRLPTRVRISWQDDRTMKLETDAGTQTRLFVFGAPAAPPAAAGPDWQGVSTASWDAPQPPVAALAFGPPGATPRSSLKVVTTRMRPGYLARNGVPYGANATLTEYFDRFDVPRGDALLVVTTEVVDPEFLSTPYWSSQQFKRETDTSRWKPTPCVAH
jgi:hypothetical protein